MNLTIIDRTVGIYPVSIGTSLAIEGLTHTGEFATNEGTAPIKDCEVLYINVRTLFRNAFGSFDDLKDRLNFETMRETIIADIEGIKEAVKAASPNTVCVIYLCTYKDATVQRTFKEANFKNPSTPNQVFYSGLEFDIYKEAPDFIEDLKLFDVELKGDKDTFILTHLPVDLLWYRNFPALTLLESHTGKIKKRTLWYTKLNGRHTIIPFSKEFLQIFGDGIMFSPQGIKVKRVILKVAEKSRWNQNTSKEKVKMTLRNANEPHVLDLYKRMS